MFKIKNNMAPELLNEISRTRHYCTDQEVLRFLKIKSKSGYLQDVVVDYTVFIFKISVFSK